MELSEKQQTAARELAEDRLSDEEIAANAGVDRRTLARWKLLPEFDEYVRDIKLELANETRRLFGIKRHDRLAMLSEQLSSLRDIRDARRRAYSVRDVVRLPDGVEILSSGAYDAGAAARAHFEIGDPCEAGKETGYLVPRYTVVGTGKNQRIVESWVVDRDLAGEIRATAEAIAHERGELPVGGAQGSEPIRRYIGVDVEAV